jgi:hypothetical protein
MKMATHIHMSAFPFPREIAYSEITTPNTGHDKVGQNDASLEVGTALPSAPVQKGVAEPGTPQRACEEIGVRIERDVEDAQEHAGDCCLSDPEKKHQERVAVRSAFTAHFCCRILRSRPGASDPWGSRAARPGANL